MPPGRWRRSLGVLPRLRFAGPRSDVPDFLRAADLFVHPSHQEGFSNAILEAMAAGLPVVACDVGGNPEAVVDGVTGRLVPPGDPTTLAKAMAEILADPGKGKVHGRGGTAPRDRTVLPGPDGRGKSRRCTNRWCRGGQGANERAKPDGYSSVLRGQAGVACGTSSEPRTVRWSRPDRRGREGVPRPGRRHPPASSQLWPPAVSDPPFPGAEDSACGRAGGRHRGGHPVHLRGGMAGLSGDSPGAREGVPTVLRPRGPRFSRERADMRPGVRHRTLESLFERPVPGDGPPGLFGGDLRRPGKPARGKQRPLLPRRPSADAVPRRLRRLPVHFGSAPPLAHRRVGRGPGALPERAHSPRLPVLRLGQPAGVLAWAALRRHGGPTRPVPDGGLRGSGRR